MFWGAKKLLICLRKYLSVRTKKLHKMKLKIYNFLFWKLNRNFKKELSPSKPLLHSTQSPILSVIHIAWTVGRLISIIFQLMIHNCYILMVKNSKIIKNVEIHFPVAPLHLSVSQLQFISPDCPLVQPFSTWYPKHPLNTVMFLSSIRWFWSGFCRILWR